MPLAKPRRRLRSIPAWAGEPLALLHPLKKRKVYPRVGGGTGQLCRITTKTNGLSPRGRGNHSERADGQPFAGSIPAWAGEPRQRPFERSVARVYPRVGGGTHLRRHLAVAIPGLSPRGRGNLTKREVVGEPQRSIPAWAGEPRSPPPPSCSNWVYPRVGGGTRATLDFYIYSYGLSPRGRGNPHPYLVPCHKRRSIPAWAGEPV